MEADGNHQHMAAALAKRAIKTWSGSDEDVQIYEAMSRNGWCQGVWTSRDVVDLADTIILTDCDHAIAADKFPICKTCGPALGGLTALEAPDFRPYWLWTTTIGDDRREET